MEDVRRLADERADEDRLSLDELAREGARRMIAAALEAEVTEHVSALVDELDEEGHRLVRRNGRSKQRRVTVGSGTVALRAPRVDDRRTDPESGERVRFSSRILPRYARRSPKVSDALPVLYLRGLSTGDFEPALSELLGEDASGLSASSISRLTEQWQAEYEAFRSRRLDFARYVYLFCDGVHVTVRLGEDDRLCLLVVVGVREDGTKELLAVEDGFRESTESWACVLRDLRERGLSEPKLVSGDGALGTWAALRDVLPEAREQRCWVHKIANVLDALPKRVQPRAKQDLHEIMESPTRAAAGEALGRFRREWDAKYPKAVEKLDRDREALFAFYDFPAEHWRHLRTTQRDRVELSPPSSCARACTKGAGLEEGAALAMAYKLLDQAAARTLAGASTASGARQADVLAGVDVHGRHPKVTDDEDHDATDKRVAA